MPERVRSRGGLLGGGRRGTLVDVEALGASHRVLAAQPTALGGVPAAVLGYRSRIAAIIGGLPAVEQAAAGGDP